MLHHSLRAPARRLTLNTALITVASAAAACSGGDGRATEDAASADTGAALGAGTAADTGMAGMDHSKMGGMDHSQMAGMNRGAPRDSNQAFLRMMSDHHQGVLMMADSAAVRATSADAKTKARQIVDKQRPGQREMLSMLSRQYGDSVTPMVMPSNRAMIDSLSGARGAEYDRTFYRQVIAHHREGIAMSGQQLPALTGEVKRMAEEMRAADQREIRELEAKLSAAPRS